MSINSIIFANCSAVKGTFSGSSSFSFNILDISDNIQFATAFALPQIAKAPSNKLDKYFDAVNNFASFSDKLYSLIYLSLLLSGNSGNAFLISSTYSSDKRIATKSGSGKYL